MNAVVLCLSFVVVLVCFVNWFENERKNRMHVIRDEGIQPARIFGAYNSTHPLVDVYLENGTPVLVKVSTEYAQKVIYGQVPRNTKIMVHVRTDTATGEIFAELA
jgi:hypothetical protein